MLQAGAALSTDPDAGRAAEEAVGAALAAAGADRADAALVFATGHRDPGLAAGAAERAGTAAIAGAALHGVLAGDREVERGPAVAALVLAGVEAEPLALPELAGAEDAAGLEIEDRLGGSATERDLVVLLLDPLALDTARLLGGLGETLGPAPVVGAAAEPGASGPAAVWSGRRPVRAGAGGLVLRLPAPPRVVVAQGCRPVTAPLVATRVEGRWLVELDGKPALDVYRDVARGPLAGDLRRAAAHLVVALPRRGPAGEGLVARRVAGFDTERGAIAVAEPIASGARLALALRDADLAREDLRQALAPIAAGSGDPPRAALYLSCAGRGEGLFGHAGLEVAYVAQAVAPAALAGGFGAFQIGPIAGAPALSTLAGVLALL